MRVTKEAYYLNIARSVINRSTCLRRRYGAIIVKNDEVISTGYNGSPRGTYNCCDKGFCEREAKNIPSGANYELCRSVHAEQNAIISASRKDMLGATLYLVGEDMKGDIIDAEPCLLCKRFILNAGISKVVCKTKDSVKITIPEKDWEL